WASAGPEEALPGDRRPQRPVRNRGAPPVAAAVQSEPPRPWSGPAFPRRATRSRLLRRTPEGHFGEREQRDGTSGVQCGCEVLPYVPLDAHLERRSRGALRPARNGRE